MPYKDPAKARECQNRYRATHKRTDKPTDSQRKAFYAQHGGQHEYNRNRQLMRSYGITLSQYNELAALQCGSCAICGFVPCEDPDAGHNQKVLHVDHDHMTGRIRGLICSNCNRAIGMMGESPQMLERAARYLTDRG